MAPVATTAPNPDRDREFLDSCGSGDVKRVRALLRTREYPVAKLHEAFELAARDGHTSVINFLVKRGLDPTHNNCRALELAVEGGHLAATQALARRVSRHPKFHNIFEKACALGEVDIIEVFLSNRVELGHNCASGLTAAAREGKLAAVKLLAERDPDPMIFVAISGAAENGHLPVVEYLATVDPTEIWRALRQAAAPGHVEVVKFALSTGIEKSYTLLALDDALTQGQMDAWKVLVDHIAESEPSEIQEIVDTALPRAAGFAQLGALQYILTNYTPSQVAKDEALTATAGAVSLGEKSLECARYLKEQGASANGNSGAAVVRAAEEGQLEMLAVLYTGDEKPELAYASEALKACARLGFDGFVDRLLILRPDLCQSGLADEALRSSSRQRHFETCRLLVTAGANPLFLPEGKILSKTRSDDGTTTFMALVREVLSWERPGTPAKFVVGERLGLHPNTLGSDAFKKEMLFRQHPIIRTALHSASVAALLFPMQSDRASAVMVKLLQADVERIQKTPGLSWTKYIDYLSTRMKGIGTFQDVIREVADCVVLPFSADARKATRRTQLAPCRAQAYLQAAERIAEGKTTLDFPALNNRWHSPASSIPTKYRALRGEWYSLFSPQLLSNGVTAIALNSAEQLKTEGEKLHHCVGRGSFASACQDGTTHIISFRTGQDHLATLELKKGGEDIVVGEDRFREGQFYGYNDGPPPAQAREAFRELKELIKSGKVSLNKERGITRESERRRPSDTILVERVTGISQTNISATIAGIETHYRERVYVERSGGARITLI